MEVLRKKSLQMLSIIHIHAREPFVITVFSCFDVKFRKTFSRLLETKGKEGGVSKKHDEWYGDSLPSWMRTDFHRFSTDFAPQGVVVTQPILQGLAKSEMIIEDLLFTLIQVSS